MLASGKKCLLPEGIARDLSFQTSRFVFCPIDRHDLSELFRWRRDPVTARYLSAPPPASWQDQERWYARYLEDETCLHFMVRTRAGEKLGYCPLTGIDSKERTAEFGLVLGNREQPGQGPGMILALTFMKFTFELLGFRALYASNHRQNDVSNSFHQRILHSRLIEGEHRYRKGEEWLFEVSRECFRAYEAAIVARRPSWARQLVIAPAT